jgi:hypothetical protein
MRKAPNVLDILSIIAVLRESGTSDPLTLNQREAVDPTGEGPLL